MRPSKLAQDNSLAIDNYIYTIDRLNEESSELYDEFIVLQPTSPFRSATDIDNAIALFYAKKADSIISVCEAPHPPAWAKKIDHIGKLREYFVIHTGNANRQDLETAYIPNGAIYIFRISLLKKLYSYYSENTFAFIMPQERSIDIDSPFDFELAEFMMRKYDKY